MIVYGGMFVQQSGGGQLTETQIFAQKFSLSVTILATD